MSTSENALPKLLRDHLTSKEFQYDRVKTTPNFTYDVQRIIKVPADGPEFDAQTEGLAYDQSLSQALLDFGVTPFKTITVTCDELVVPEGEEGRMYRLTDRIKAVGYEAPAPVFKEKTAPAPKAAKEVKVKNSSDGPEGLRVLLNVGVPLPETKVKSASPKKGKKGIVSPAVSDDIPSDADIVNSVAEAEAESASESESENNVEHAASAASF